MILMLLQGCTTQQAFHVMHALDTVQTIRGPALTDGCYETDPITRQLIGAKPSVGEVLLWSAGVALLFEGLRHAMPERWRPWLEWGAVAAKAYVVASNVDNGIPVVGHVECR